MPGIPPRLEAFVCEQARKVFAILLHSQIQAGKLMGALELCKHYGFTDDLLPIPENAELSVCTYDSCGNARPEQACQHQRYLNISTLR